MNESIREFLRNIKILTVTFNRLIAFEAFAILFTGAAALTGCSDLPDGTPEQATAAREQFNDGVAALNTKELHISDMLNRFQQVPVVTMIVKEPPVLPIMDVEHDTVAPLFGTYVENATGGFDLTSPSTTSVEVHYLNGINFSIIHPAWTPLPTQRLLTYKLSISSNNRGTDTPLSDEVDVFIDMEFYPYFQTTPRSANDTTSIARVDIASFYPPGATERANYTMEREIKSQEGVEIVTSNTTQAGTKKIVTSKRRKIVDLNTGDIYQETEDFTYVLYDLTAAWFGFGYYYQFYIGELRDLSYVVAWQGDSQQTVTTTGVATYMPGNISTSIFNNLGVAHQNFKVAIVEGGPFTCDMLQQGGTGTGTGLQLIWHDKVATDLLPSLEFPCTKMNLPW